jgi:hypothetical protein
MRELGDAGDDPRARVVLEYELFRGHFRLPEQGDFLL